MHTCRLKHPLALSVSTMQPLLTVAWTLFPPSHKPAGALNRVIDRGTRGINWTLSSMVFNVVPTVFEVAMVSAILTVKCGVGLAGLTCGTVGAYMAFTFAVTQVGGLHCVDPVSHARCTY